MLWCVNVDKLSTYLCVDELFQGTAAGWFIVQGQGRVCSGSTAYFHIIQWLILMYQFSGCYQACGNSGGNKLWQRSAHTCHIFPYLKRKNQDKLFVHKQNYSFSASFSSSQAAKLEV